MVFSGVENGDEDANDAVGFKAVSEGGAVGVCEEGAGEIADGGNDYGEVIAAIPEAIVGCLVAEDLGEMLIRRKVWLEKGRTREMSTSIRPTTMERLGIWEDYVSHGIARTKGKSNNTGW